MQRASSQIRAEAEDKKRHGLGAGLWEWVSRPPARAYRSGLSHSHWLLWVSSLLTANCGASPKDVGIHTSRIGAALHVTSSSGVQSPHLPHEARLTRTHDARIGFLWLANLQRNTQRGTFSKRLSLAFPIRAQGQTLPDHPPHKYLIGRGLLETILEKNKQIFWSRVRLLQDSPRQLTHHPRDWAGLWRFWDQPELSTYLNKPKWEEFPRNYSILIKSFEKYLKFFIYLFIVCVCHSRDAWGVQGKKSDHCSCSYRWGLAAQRQSCKNSK